MPAPTYHFANCFAVFIVSPKPEVPSGMILKLYYGSTLTEIQFLKIHNKGDVENPITIPQKAGTTPESTAAAEVAQL